jgi:hypothetical protein
MARLTRAKLKAAKQAAKAKGRTFIPIIQPVRGYVGFLDGVPHVERRYLTPTKRMHVLVCFISQRAAKRHYEDVRPARVVF